MRKVILLIHISLDGFTAGQNGEMNWIKVDDEMFEIVGKMTDDADTALFGKITYKMMESYWPTAGQQPNASKHDIEHSEWLQKSEKILFSNTVKETEWDRTTVMNGDIKSQINDLKKKTGKNMLMIGSISIGNEFMNLGLIDEFYINVNPVILGGGKPLFKDIKQKIALNLISAKKFKSGVVGLHYSVK